VIEEAGLSRYHLLTLFEFKKQLIFLQERQVHTSTFFFFQMKHMTLNLKDYLLSSEK
jgi:hypothetical protein